MLLFLCYYYVVLRTTKLLWYMEMQQKIPDTSPTAELAGPVLPREHKGSRPEAGAYPSDLLQIAVLRPAARVFIGRAA